MVGAWPPSQIKLLDLHRQNAQQANREKHEAMQTTYFLISGLIPYLGLMCLKIKKGLLPWRYRHHTNTPYHVQRAKTNQPIDYKDHGNPTTHECVNPSTHKLINSKTHQLVNSKTQKIISSSTHKLINQKNHKLTNLSTHKLINSKTHQLINSKTRQFKNSKNHQLINPQTH